MKKTGTLTLFASLLSMSWMIVGAYAAPIDDSPWPNHDRDKDNTIIYKEGDVDKLTNDENLVQLNEMFYTFKSLPQDKRQKFIDSSENMRTVLKFMEHHLRELGTKNNIYEPLIRKCLTMLCASGQQQGISWVITCLRSTPNFYDKRMYQEVVFSRRADLLPELDTYIRKWENYYPAKFKDEQQSTQAIQVFCWLYGDIKQDAPKEQMQLIMDSYQRLKAKYQGNEAGQKFLKEMRKNFQFLDKEAFEKDMAPPEEKAQ